MQPVVIELACAVLAYATFRCCTVLPHRGRPCNIQQQLQEGARQAHAVTPLQAGRGRGPARDGSCQAHPLQGSNQPSSCGRDTAWAQVPPATAAAGCLGPLRPPRRCWLPPPPRAPRPAAPPPAGQAALMRCRKGPARWRRGQRRPAAAGLCDSARMHAMRARMIRPRRPKPQQQRRRLPGASTSAAGHVDAPRRIAAMSIQSKRGADGCTDVCACPRSNLLRLGLLVLVRH